MKKALIFGIGGFVGKYLSKELQENEYEIIGSDILDTIDLPGVVYRKADILNEETVGELIKRNSPKVIINLAAISSVGMSWEKPQQTMLINVIGSLNIMEAVRKVSPKSKILLVGSSEQYEKHNVPIDESVTLDASNPYGISKVTQEKIAEMYRKKYGIQIFCVRSFNHTGVGQSDTFVLPSFCKQVASISVSGKPGTIKVGNLNVWRDFSDVRDIVRAYRMIIDNNHFEKTYNIGSGNPYCLKDLLDFIISLSDADISVEIDKKRLRPTDTSRICCDNTQLKRIGWSPKYSVYDTLKEMYNEYKLEMRNEDEKNSNKTWKLLGKETI